MRDDAMTEAADGRRMKRQRQLLLARIKRWLDWPMALLGLGWLALLLVELLRGLGPFLQLVVNAIWAVFLIDFLLELAVAPDKAAYLRRNWLTALSLLAPALRLLRVARVARALRTLRVIRGLRLLRIVSSVNRGLKALGRHMSRRGFPYVLAITLIVTLAGSAGMYAFERDTPGASGGLPDYGTALWWTAMIMTTMGSEWWPRTPEGRLLCFLLALYSFAVFGYVTAALASYFVGRDAENGSGAPAGTAQLDRLLQEVGRLREELHASKGAALREPEGASVQGLKGAPGPRA